MNSAPTKKTLFTWCLADFLFFCSFSLLVREASSYSVIFYYIITYNSRLPLKKQPFSVLKDVLASFIALTLLHCCTPLWLMLINSVWQQLAAPYDTVYFHHFIIMCTQMCTGWWFCVKGSVSTVLWLSGWITLFNSLRKSVIKWWTVSGQFPEMKINCE